MEGIARPRNFKYGTVVTQSGFSQNIYISWDKARCRASYINEITVKYAGLKVSIAPQLFTEPISKKSGAVGSASHVRWSCSKPAVSWGPDNTVTKFLHTWVMVHYSRIVSIHAE